MGDIRRRLRPGWFVLGGLALFVVSLLLAGVSATAGTALFALAVAAWLVAVALWLTSPGGRLPRVRALGSVLSILGAVVFGLASLEFAGEAAGLVAVPSPTGAVAGATATSHHQAARIAVATPIARSGATTAGKPTTAATDSQGAVPSPHSPTPSAAPATAEPTETASAAVVAASLSSLGVPTAVPAHGTPTPLPVVPPTPPPAPRPTPRATPRPIAPPSPRPTITVGFLTLTSPIRHGAYATAAVRTLGAARCSIVVDYKSGPSKAKGLVPETASSSGIASWTWKVGTNTTPGSWPVIVSCSAGGRSSSATAYLRVT